MYAEKYGLLLTLTLLIFGCQSQNIENKNISLSQENCLEIEHSQGKTCIPKNWQTVVTLDSVTAENLIALGIKPVGTTFSSLSQHFEDELINVTNIGEIGEPNLEKILQLKPDLIVGIDSNENIYNQLSQIAPTVLVKFNHSGEWREVFKNFSILINKEELWQKSITDYENRLVEFKQKMGNNLAEIEVSVVRIYPDSINLYLRDSFAGTILTDAGLSRPESQNIGAEEAQKITGNPIQMKISKEALNQADGDVIFIWTGENDPQINAELQQKIIELQKDPLWQNLKAVKNGRVYQVPSYWIGSGPLAANLILDDLFKYLVPLENK
ncbi:MAG: iron-siderophore ABC transporter substrate-binding protein [Cyanobacterium sp. T60_A2020_053]|nr:iron-siderophore ABC transporter substrate-binding protein [Cyanobacterium sp. T60_A2020_053]